MLRRLTHLLIAAVVLGPGWTGPAAAQAFPTRPVRLIVPYPPSGATDLLARLYAQHLSALWGQTVFVDNKPGAGGNIGTDAVAKAPPDGYTMLLVSNGLAINESLYPVRPFDAVRDLAPLGIVASTPMILAASPKSGIHSLADLTTRAKASPGKLPYASCGNGTPQHLALELYQSMAGVSLLHVPYKGCAPAVSDLLGDQIPMMAASTAVMIPLIESGKVIPLAQTGSRRSAGAPAIPTFAESGIKDYEANIWFGLLVPAVTPAAIRQKISADLLKVSQMVDVQGALKSNSIEENRPDAAVMAEVVRKDIAKYAGLIKHIGVKID